jgi:spore germination cell wall hydrolase CwlJ-like protein
MTEEQKRICNIFMLALVVWRESRGEGPDGRIGVAFSIMNRVARPSWWGDSIQNVCGKKYQYSSFTDPHDPQLTNWPKDTDPSWLGCMNVAEAVLDGKVENPVPGADSYFDLSIKAPAWATPEIFVKQIGRLKFYNVDRDIEK